MPCYHPLHAWRDSDGIRFVAGKTLSNLKLPCGQCIGCRLERSRQWAVRCMHEAQMHRYNTFLTLTLADEHLVNRYFTGNYDERTKQPIYSGTLTKRHHQLFLKRLRKAVAKEISPATPPVGGGRFLITRSTPDGATAAPHKPAAHPLRYYMAGEYGSRFARPHYHLCIFGIDFADKYYWRTTPAGSKIFRSPTLEQLWPFGHSTIGALTFESAAYTARYVMKKINGKQQEKHYEVIDHETGEILRLLPEYNDMSRGNRLNRSNAIGKEWITKYHADVYKALPGKVIVRGKEANSPRYYDKQLEKWDPDAYEILIEHRTQEGKKYRSDQTRSRLAVREQVAKAKIRQLKRNI